MDIKNTSDRLPPGGKPIPTPPRDVYIVDYKVKVDDHELSLTCDVLDDREFGYPLEDLITRGIYNDLMNRIEVNGKVRAIRKERKNEKL